MDADEFRAGLHVLVVDDDDVSLVLIAKQLRHCKYNVTTVKHAEMALEILKARRDDVDQFDLVITDVHMPRMDGFKLLELIGLEMDIPVIMLSANDTLEAMMKGIQHGAHDYFAKPARLEQLKTLWMHVVRNKMNDPSSHISNSDDDGQKLQSRDDEAENCVRQNMKCLRKKKKDGYGKREDQENTSTSKRIRFQWSGERHRKFVEVVNRIGMDKAVPKKILEMMNVEGLRREHVASHLQKYRLYLKKLGSGTFSHHGLSNDDIAGQEYFEHNLEHGRYYQRPMSFGGSSSSSNPFAKMNSSAAFGTHSLLPTQSVKLMTQRSLGVPLMNMGPFGHGGNMSQVAVPGSHQGLSSFASCDDTSNTDVHFLSSPSRSPFANISNGTSFNMSKSFHYGSSSNSFLNVANGSSPLMSGMECLLSPFKSYARKCIIDGALSSPSSKLPVQQPLESAALFNGHSGFPNSEKTMTISKFLDLGCKGETTEAGSSHGNMHKINQLSRLAASSGQNTEFHNQMAALTKKTATSMAYFNEQVEPFNIGSNTNSTMMTNHKFPPGGASSAVSMSPNLQMNKPNLLSPMLNGESEGDGGIVNQQVVGDKLNNNTGFLITTNTTSNGTNEVWDDFLGDLLNQDVLTNDDALMDGDWEFTP